MPRKLPCRSVVNCPRQGAPAECLHRTLGWLRPSSWAGLARDMTFPVFTQGFLDGPRSKSAEKRQKAFTKSQIRAEVKRCPKRVKAPAPLAAVPAGKDAKDCVDAEKKTARQRVRARKSQSTAVPAVIRELLFVEVLFSGTGHLSKRDKRIA